MKKALVLFVLAIGFVRTASASADEVQTYTVQPGDRLERVAARYGLTGEELLAANPRSAYGIKCGNPQRVTRQNGTTRFICGGDLPYLIAGKTLIVPEPQILIQARNTELQTELVMLRAEMGNLEKEIETGKSALADMRQERDNLVSERDDLRDENIDLAAAKAELEGKYSGVDLANQRIILSGRRNAQSSDDNTIAIFAVLGFAVVVMFIFAFYYSPNRKTKRLAEQARRDRERVAAEQQAIVRDREEAAKKRQEVEEKQRKLDDERTAHALELQTREVERATMAVEKDYLGDQGAEFAGLLLGLEFRLRELRRRNSDLNSRETKLYLAQENFVASQKLLEEARQALRQDREAHYKEVRRLAELRDRVEAGLRTLDEDGPALTRDRQAVQTQVEQITQRIGTVVAREIDVKDRENRAAAREKAAQSREEEVSRREDQAAVLAEREQAVRAAEEGFARAEDDLRKKQEGFERSMEESRQELVDRGRDLDDREARLADRAQASADETDDGSPTVTFPAPPDEPVDPRSATGIEINPGPTQRVESVDIEGEASINPPAQTASDGPKTCVREGGGEVALTSSEAHLGTCVPVSVTCGVCRRKFADRREFNEHRSGCPEAVPHTPTIQGSPAAPSTTSLHDTDLEIPIAKEPSHEESGFYCAVCHQSFSAEEYARDHAAHNTGLPKPD